VKRVSSAALAAVVLAGALAAVPAAAEAAPPEPPPGAVPYVMQGVTATAGPRRDIRGWIRDGVVFVGVNDLSRIMGIAIHWRSELGKVTLDLGEHAVWVMDGSDFAVVDGEVVHHLPAPAFLWGGEMLVPMDLLVTGEGAPRPWTPGDFVFHRDRRLVSYTRRSGAALTGVRIESDPMGWKLVLETDGDVRPRVVRAEEASLVFRIEGVRFDPLMFTLPTDHPWFGGLRLRSVPGGVEGAFSPPSQAVGYRVETTPGTVQLLLGADERDLLEGTLTRFTVSRRSLPEVIYRVALDPAHGGRGGAAAAREGRMAEAVCWKLADRLRNRFGLEVVFTRHTEETPAPETRAERANRARADLLLSFHFPDRMPGIAAVVARPGASEDTPEGLRWLGFTPFYAAHDPQLPTSRILARNLVDAISSRTGAPSLGVFEESVGELQAANMPAVILEIGTGGKGLTDDALYGVAEGVVEGIQLFLVLTEQAR